MNVDVLVCGNFLYLAIRYKIAESCRIKFVVAKIKWRKKKQASNAGVSRQCLKDNMSKSARNVAKKIYNFLQSNF